MNKVMNANLTLFLSNNIIQVDSGVLFMHKFKENSLLLAQMVKTIDKSDLYLITGANGQLGSEWVDYLKASKIKFIALGSKDLDITDHQSVRSFLIQHKPTFLVNCAAYTKVDLAETEIDLSNRVNHHAVENLAKVCSEENIILLHYSTDYIFGGLESDRKKFPAGYPVGATVNPKNQYGKSKLLGEVALARNHDRAIIIRVSWLCGRHGSNFVKTILKIATNNPEISVVNDQFGSPSFTKSVVLISDAILSKRAFGTHHVSSDGILSWHKLAEKIVQKNGLPCFVKPVDSLAYPSKVKRPAFSKLDCSETEKLLGIRMENWHIELIELLKELNEIEFL
jgi:dTDP-4-dehydrorhamnose reductase